MNKGVKISFKDVTTNLFTLVVLLVEIIIDTVKPKGCIETYTYIS